MAGCAVVRVALSAMRIAPADTNQISIRLATRIAMKRITDLLAATAADGSLEVAALADGIHAGTR
jgi:hypothetical protein